MGYVFIPTAVTRFLGLTQQISTDRWGQGTEANSITLAQNPVNFMVAIRQSIHSKSIWSYYLIHEVIEFIRQVIVLTFMVNRDFVGSFFPEYHKNSHLDSQNSIALSELETYRICLIYVNGHMHIGKHSLISAS